MNERLVEIMQYRTGGRQMEFAALMGWTPQYLAKLIKGESFGIRPVLAILEAMPEIDARWFLCGTGSMFGDGRSAVRNAIREKIQALTEIEASLSSMTDREAVQAASALKKINLENLKPCSPTKAN